VAKRTKKRRARAPKLYQPVLPQLDCAMGWHGTLVYGEPIDKGSCVNRDVGCLQCGEIVATESWTPEAWARRGKDRLAPGPDSEYHP